MIRLGITGGIGSGKSVVSALLQIMRVPVYIADAESKLLVDTSPDIRARLTELFGADIYYENHLDRSRLASLIFNNATLLAEVNAAIHPEVLHHFRRWSSGLSSPVCGIETAILFETGFHRDVDFSILVYAPQELRIIRTMQRDGSDRQSVMKRIQNQMPDEEKLSLASFIVYNDGERALIPQVHSILRQLGIFGE
ncbi:MAG: dephospho-CoA kinase [Tannerellaceae bacterium]|jgi:dephospho-CoA kinase|nr:dephospho-CoA kinase [Tannerellaceae bacterium]